MDRHPHKISFFTPSGFFTILRTVVFPALLKDRPSENPLKFWIPECSTGEIAYSTAMTLLEFCQENRTAIPFDIFATNSQYEKITQTRKQCFLKSELKGVSARRRKSFFDSISNKESQIKDPVRSGCIFARLDPLKDPPISHVQLIICRNSFRSLKPAQRHRLSAILFSSLEPGGFLILNAAPTGAMAESLKIINKKWHIYQKPKDFLPQATKIKRPDEISSSPKPLIHPSKPRFLSALDNWRSQNEKLKNANSELLSAKKELQSVNQELLSVNEELARRNEELSQTKADLTNLLESLDLSLLILSKDLLIRKFNRSAGEVFGLTQKHAGRKMTEIKFKKIQNLNIKEIFQMDQILSQPLKQEVQDTSGQWHLLEIKVYRASDQQPDGFLVTLVNIHSLKQAEEILRRDKTSIENIVQKRTEELFQSQKSLENAKRLSDIGTLAATVAHELRNPLASIGMASSNIEKKMKDQMLERHLKTIKKKVVESDRIINNLLFYSRIKKPSRESFIPQTILKECVQSVSQCIKKKVEIKIKFQLRKIPLLLADPLQIKGLILNILNNACDAVPDEGGKVELNVNCDKKFLYLEIRDNGVGIKKEMIEKLGEPFFTTKPKGTGLGLAVCRQIIEGHSGTLQFDSEPGKGTVVRITLPLKSEIPAVEGETTREPAQILQQHKSSETQLELEIP